MKRTHAVLALCASFLFLLSACGEDSARDDVGDMLDEAGDMMEDAMDGSEGAMRSGRDFSGNTGAVTEEGRAGYGSARNNSGMQNGSSGMQSGSGAGSNGMQSGSGGMQSGSGSAQSGSGAMDKNTNATANSTLRGSYDNPTGTQGGSRSRSNQKQEEQDDPGAAKTRWQLMLDNAHVHDTDGFLYDGENPQNDTF